MSAVATPACWGCDVSAVKHHIRTKFFLGNTWTNVTNQLLVRDKVKISGGRQNESTEGSPLTSLFTLKNDSLQWTPENPLSPYYEDLKQNVPVLQEFIIASDDFDRTSSAGLGAALTGQVWSSFGSGGSVSASDVSISGGMARFSVPATLAHRTAYLVGESLFNAAAECTFQLPTSNVTGGDLEPGNLLLRFVDSSNYYMFRVVVTTSETVTIRIIAVVGGAETTLGGPITVPGLTNTGQRMRVKAWVENETLRAKVWDEALGEPLDDHISTRDRRITAAGSVAIRCGVSGTNTNTLPVVFGIDDFSFYSPRFSGEISKISVADNEKGSDRHAKIQAAGILRRLGQGDAPVMSSLKRGYLGIGSTLINYWPCEEGTSADSIASALGAAPMHLVGSPDFAANNDFPCSQPIPQLNNSGWFGDVPDYTFSGEIQCRALLSVTSATPPPDETVIIRLFSQEGSIRVWELLYKTGGNLMVKGFNAADVEVFTTGSLGFGVNDVPLRVSFELENVGADTTWFVSCLSVEPGAIGGFITGTVTGFNCGKVFQVMIGPQGIADRLAIGHVSLESARTDLFANLKELQAHFGEDAGARASRLCRENGIRFTHYESAAADGTLMGYQRPLKLLELLREVEKTDGGVLRETRSFFGLEYRSRKQAYGQSPRLTASVAAKQVGWPFRPVVDDQLVRNDVTVEQPDGSSARAEQTTGPKSVLPYPDGIGRVDTTVPVNTSSTSLLRNHAEWRLAIGTTVAPRTPDVKLNIVAAEVKPLLRNILDLVQNDRVLFTNAGERTGFYDPISELVQGMSEEWTNHEGVFVVHGAPEGPYAVGAVDGDRRLDSGSSTLSAALSASATGTFSVATSDRGDLWITTATHQPDAFGTNHFPVDIMIGGERITISSITGATSPQTFTISSRGVNGVKEPGAVGKAHASGAGVHAADPFILGL